MKHLRQPLQPKVKRDKPLRRGTGRIEISKSKVLRLNDLRTNPGKTA